MHKFRNIKIRPKNTPTYKPFPNGFFSVPDQHLLFGMLLGVIFYDLAVGTKGMALGKHEQYILGLAQKCDLGMVFSWLSIEM